MLFLFSFLYSHVPEIPMISKELRVMLTRVELPLVRVEDVEDEEEVDENIADVVDETEADVDVDDMVEQIIAEPDVVGKEKLQESETDGVETIDTEKVDEEDIPLDGIDGVDMIVQEVEPGLDEEMPEDVVPAVDKVSIEMEVDAPTNSSRMNPERLTRAQRELHLKQQILYGAESGLMLKKMAGKGLGVFPTRAFAKGEYICTYIADLLSMEQAREREIMYGPQRACYMYYVKWGSKYVW
jgi:hypothetical protein